jgi:hypothetical protein
LVTWQFSPVDYSIAKLTEEGKFRSQHGSCANRNSSNFKMQGMIEFNKVDGDIVWQLFSISACMV